MNHNYYADHLSVTKKEDIWCSHMTSSDISGRMIESGVLQEAQMTMTCGQTPGGQFQRGSRMADTSTSLKKVQRNNHGRRAELLYNQCRNYDFWRVNLTGEKFL